MFAENSTQDIPMSLLADEKIIEEAKGWIMNIMK
jgi:hypothetical protein